MTRDERREYARAWRAQNREKLRLQERARRAANPEAFRERQRRWVSSNREKAIEYKRQYRARGGAEKDSAYIARNRQAIYAKNAAYRAANREKERLRGRLKYARSDKARSQALAAERKKRNPSLYKAISRLVSARRRARRLNAQGNATREQVEARVAVYGYRCAYCGGPFEHVDHVVPLSRGGSNWPANLRPACSRCNTSKGSKSLAEWMCSR